MISVVNDWITSKSDWERNIMLKTARRGRNLSFKCYASVTIVIILHLWISYIKFQRSMHQPQRILIYQFNYLYNSQRSPNYEITFFIQLCSGLLVGITNCTIDSFVSIFLLHVCAQLINLRITLNNTINELVNKTMPSLTFKESLIAIVSRHEHLIRYLYVYIFNYLIAKNIQKFSVFIIVSYIYNKNKCIQYYLSKNFF